MDLKRMSLIFMLIFFIVIYGESKYSKVRLRGKELNLHGIRGQTHFENKKVIKKYEAIGRSALMRPDAGDTLDRVIDERLEANNGEECGDSCEADWANGTEYNAVKITERAVTEDLNKLGDGGTITIPSTPENVTTGDLPRNTTTADKPENSTTKEMIILTLQGDDDDEDVDTEETYESIEDYDNYEYEETTYHPTSSEGPISKYPLSRVNIVYRPKPWFVPPSAINMPIADSYYAVVPEAQIGDKCDFQLFNESTGYYLDSLYSKRGDEWSEEEEEKFLLDYEDKLLNYSTTNATVLNTICLNEFNLLTCHSIKHTCYCGSHGYLRLEQQLGIYTCTALLGHYCDVPYVYCSEDFDCVNRTCTVHNYSSAKRIKGHETIAILLLVLLVSCGSSNQ